MRLNKITAQAVVTAKNFVASKGGFNGDMCYVLPIVSLKSNIQMEKINTGTENEAWELKID